MVLNINDLNEDCLLKIFSYLTGPQLIGVERVCVKWRETCLESWSRRKVFSFKMQEWKGTQQDLIKILGKCERHVTNLDLHEAFMCYDSLDKSPLTDPSSFIFVLGHHCSNLKHLNLSNYQISNKAKVKPFISKLAKNLTTLKLNDCKVDDDALIAFFKNVCDLQEVSLESSNIIGTSLLDITNKLKFLNVNKCYKLELDVFAHAMSNFQNLEVLKANHTCVNVDVIKLLPNCLRELSIQNVSSQCFELNLSFPSLETLHVGYNKWMTAENIAMLGDICPNLVELNIQESLELTSLKYLVKLTKLKILRMDNNSIGIDNELLLQQLSVLGNIRLKTISCSSCGLMDTGASGEALEEDGESFDDTDDDEEDEEEEHENGEETSEVDEDEEADDHEDSDVEAGSDYDFEGEEASDLEIGNEVEAGDEDNSIEAGSDFDGADNYESEIEHEAADNYRDEDAAVNDCDYEEAGSYGDESAYDYEGGDYDAADDCDYDYGSYSDYDY